MSATKNIDLINSIINGCTAKNIDETKSISNDSNFSIISISLINKLSKSLTTLLSYNVSQKVYQRYEVRLEIIDTIRDLCCLKGNLRNLKIFQDSEKSYSFLIDLLKKYITKETLDNLENPDDLIEIAQILLNANKLNKSFVTLYFSKIIERIICLEQSNNSIKFLEYIIEKSEDLKVNRSTVAKIFSEQNKIFVEQPVLENFKTYCGDQIKFQSREIDFLSKIASKIPEVFYMLSNQLKEIFVTTEYSNISLNFIQMILDKVKLNCDKNKKDTLNLYPENLQHCVILLRIKPNNHTQKSRNHTIDSLKEIFLNDWNGALILISHYPDWLPDYLKFFEILKGSTQESIEVITIEDN